MDAKVLFKKLVHDAKRLQSESMLETPRPIMSFGSQRITDFQTAKKAHNDGRFAHLTDAYIDDLSDAGVEQEMVSFIYRCFQQR